MAFQELIAKYKELIRKDGNTGELYKWQCIKHFQENFYIDTPDFHVMLKNALRERENLLYFISSSFILEASEQYPDETRQMFSSLYDEEVDLKKRIQNFQLSSDAILPKLKNVDDKSRHQQDERTVSFYLALRYPEKYPLYMYVIYNFMLQCFPDETKKRPGERFLHFNEIGHKLSDLIDKDTELQSLVMNTLDESCFKDRQAMVIFQDILWRCHQESEGIKLARICWNTKEWTSPSGSEGKSPSDDSHEGKYGFGNEEWLFDFSRMIDGYHYGYLQPINKGGKKYLSAPIDILLYTIDGKSKKRYLVAKIKNLHVLSEEEAKEVFQKYKANGWLAEMEQQLIDASAKGADNFHEWSGLNVLNVKFDIKDVIMYDMYELPPEHFLYKKMDRYRLYIRKENISSDMESEKDFDPNISGGNSAKPFSSGNPPLRNILNKTIEISNLHQQISEKLFTYLLNEYGNDKVAREKDTSQRTLIDIYVNDNGKYIFYEIKALTSARAAIREALGQLLEYSMWPDRNIAHKMVIVSLRLGDSLIAQKYVEHVRRIYNIPVYYQEFDLKNCTFSKIY